MMQSIRRLIAPLALAFTLSSCASVAEVAGYDTRSLNATAQESYAQVLDQAKKKGVLDKTSITSRRVHRVFDRLKPHAEAANETGVPFEWEMNVLRSDTVNAWAMPGGKMAVYTGIVEKLKLNNDEISAIVGHEMAHAIKEHSKKAVGQQVITGVVGGVLGGIASAYSGVDMTSSVSLLADLGIGKPFSRSQESEADAIGLRLMAQAGYNPEYALSLWEKMNKNNDNNDIFSAILSTHPTNNKRIENIRALLPEVMPIYRKAKNRR